MTNTTILLIHEAREYCQDKMNCLLKLNWTRQYPSGLMKHYIHLKPGVKKPKYFDDTIEQNDYFIGEISLRNYLEAHPNEWQVESVGNSSASLSGNKKQSPLPDHARDEKAEKLLQFQDPTLILKTWR